MVKSIDTTVYLYFLKSEKKNESFYADQLTLDFFKRQNKSHDHTKSIYKVHVLMHVDVPGFHFLILIL